jgi:hypothetical protein
MIIPYMNTCACTLDLLYLILPTGSYPQYQAVHIVFYTWLIGAYLLEISHSKTVMQFQNHLKIKNRITACTGAVSWKYSVQQRPINLQIRTECQPLFARNLRAGSMDPPSPPG